MTRVLPTSNECKVLTKRYQEALDSAGNEQTVQEFLEHQSELIPLEWMLGHGLHLDMVLSKLQINTSLTCDFAYLTKNTAEWYVVLVELENFNKKIFRSDLKRVTFSADFTEAFGQIESWRSQLKRDSGEIQRKLAPLMLPMANNPIHYKFILVYGRDAEFGRSRERSNRFYDKADPDIKVLTYDSLLRRLDGSYSAQSKNIFTMSQQQFELKHLHNLTTSMFRWISRDYVSVSAQQEKLLRQAGFEMDVWNKGELLRCETEGYKGTSFEEAAKRVMKVVTVKESTKT